jgi:hypothetical protein
MLARVVWPAFGRLSALPFLGRISAGVLSTTLVLGVHLVLAERAALMLA